MRLRRLLNAPEVPGPVFLRRPDETVVEARRLTFQGWDGQIAQWVAVFDLDDVLDLLRGRATAHLRVLPPKTSVGFRGERAVP